MPKLDYQGTKINSQRPKLHSQWLKIDFSSGEKFTQKIPKSTRRGEIIASQSRGTKSMVTDQPLSRPIDKGTLSKNSLLGQTSGRFDKNLLPDTYHHNESGNYSA